jgi:hypothetical protein
MHAEIFEFSVSFQIMQQQMHKHACGMHAASMRHACVHKTITQCARQQFNRITGAPAPLQCSALLRVLSAFTFFFKEGYFFVFCF